DNDQRAEAILRENMDKLHAMAGALIKYETIDEPQLKDIMAGREPRPPEGWDSSGPTPTPSSPPPTGSSKGDPALGEPAKQH
ncbi:MAG: ATP-dependent metalloprotease, partial [Gammaproteobacteria bacterium]|nr:ATP-dependent metalloprotease [Gammaproteobacteria bacterium]